MTRAQHAEDDLGTVNLHPAKRLYQPLTADISPNEALLELIDNSIDHHRALRARDKATITVEHGFDDPETRDGEYIRIVDDAGGVPINALESFFALGDSLEQSDFADDDEYEYDKKENIGWAGLGSKRSTLRLGRYITFKSRFMHNDTGYGFSVDQEWLEKENDWERDIVEYDDLENGETVVEIRDLRIDWEEVAGPENERLRNVIADTYDLFLAETRIAKSPLSDIDISIELQDETLEKSVAKKSNGPVTDVVNDEFAWSFLPFDDFHPRRYENLPLVHEDSRGIVRLSITVGVLTTASTTKAGVTLYAHGRKLLSANTGEQGGFGAPGGLKKFRPENHERLVIIAELEAEENSEDLPWNSTKTGIDTGHPIARELHRKLKNAAQDYMQVADNGLVPTPITEPYSADHDQAGNRGEIQLYDYSSKQKIMDKPGSQGGGRYQDRPELDEVIAMARRDAWFCVDRSSVLDDWKVPAYTNYLANRITAYHTVEDLRHLSATPKEIDRGVPANVEINEETDTKQTNDKTSEHTFLKELATLHAQRGKYYTELEQWQVPFYKEYLAQAGREDFDQLIETNELAADETRESIISDTQDSPSNGPPDSGRQREDTSESSTRLAHASERTRNSISDAYGTNVQQLDDQEYDRLVSHVFDEISKTGFVDWNQLVPDNNRIR